MPGSAPDAKSVFRYLSVRVVGRRAQALPLRWNILLLYGNMEQLAKLRMSIFALSIGLA